MKNAKSKTKAPSKRAKKSTKRKSISYPVARRVLFRPDRYNYVKKLLPDQGCVFCEAATHEVGFSHLCVYKSEHSMVLLNKFPYNSGHLLILPRSHKGSLLALTDHEFVDLNSTMRMAMKAVQDIYKPLAMNLGLNQGKAAGAGIPEHLHYHLIPRWEGDLNFFPLIAETKVVIESLEQTYQKLHDYFKEHL